MTKDDFEKFTGNISLTYSFRMTIDDTKKVLDYQPLVIEIKGIKFKIERMK